MSALRPLAAAAFGPGVGVGPDQRLAVEPIDRGRVDDLHTGGVEPAMDADGAAVVHRSRQVGARRQKQDAAGRLGKLVDKRVGRGAVVLVVDRNDTLAALGTRALGQHRHRALPRHRGVAVRDTLGAPLFRAGGQNDVIRL